ncbi:MAG: transglycosylase SLT domain-containing protein [Betaproteobacteria bacterium]|nr:transglycosylase SLT domain-containing protein [Betaproteobacteria bacterium]
MKSTTSHLCLLAALRWIALCLALVCADAVAQPVATIETLEAAAKRGDVAALFTLAEKYKRGDEVTRDIPRSNLLYCKAAARGNVDALLELGLIHASGREMMANEGVGALLINMAAERGSERAKEILPYISRGVGSMVPACFSEETAIAAQTAAAAVPAVRKDIELMVQQWAPQYALDPNLVMALIAVESQFDAKAVSPKNAQGLMQLIPATAERFGVANAFNPLQNLKGGLAYLRWLMAYFKGEVALVLAAYNAGELAVERYRGIPPYAETRNYVKQITSVYKNTTHPYLAEIAAPSPVFARLSRADPPRAKD